MKDKIAVIHTTSLVLEPVKKALEPLLSDFSIFHNIDEALLAEMMEKGNTPEITDNTLCSLINRCVAGGASLIVVSCSSLSPSVERIKSRFTTPIIAIDVPMVTEVLSRFNKPLFIMTNPTMKMPAESLLSQTVKKLNLKKIIPTKLCDGAFLKLQQGDILGHDSELVEMINNFSCEYDSIILAQISMERVRTLLEPNVRAKTFSSLDFIEQAIRDKVGV